MIVFRNVTKKFRSTAVLSDVSFRVDPGEFVCLTGPSGAGKTTVLSLLIGATAPTEGAVEVDGVDLRSVPPQALQLYRRRVGVVFQDLKLLPHLTLEENVAFPLEVAGIADAAARSRVTDALKWTELTERAGEFPSELSGGERARAALARAIVHQPLIVAADEPTGNLDPVESIAILQLLRHLHRDEGVTVILATHDAALVDTLQSRVLRLEGGKLIRDSIGGYDRVKKAQPKSPPAPGEHHVFAETESGRGHKVHVTPIGGI